MKLNKTYYWLGLIIFFSIILGLRYFSICFINIRIEIFYTLFALWLCLVLLPLFSEIEFLGIKLKKEFQALRDDVKHEIQSIRNEFNNNNKQQIFLEYGPPPTDSKIPELEKDIEMLKNRFEISFRESDSSGLLNVGQQGLTGRFDIPENTMHLFKIRYNIETLLTKIWDKYSVYVDSYQNKNIYPTQILKQLSSIDVIDNLTLNLTRDILSICNASIHGNKVTGKQIDFVTKNSRSIYDRLNQVHKEA